MYMGSLGTIKGFLMRMSEKVPATWDRILQRSRCSVLSWRKYEIASRRRLILMLRRRSADRYATREKARSLPRRLWGQ